ncbi:MAG: (2Fe-2S)-binding protein [Xanthomonadales bacterium]|jgi:aerobic-type carbon monoxide dehydrogenase small subunit (CoxS/CutS family)|nr:(2Fe-2S)-binding protein [Xanthomonadales bacterium]
MIQLTVNGEKQAYEGEGDLPLLWYLRDFLGLTGSKYGCGKGLCGACTVHLDGQAIRSCSVPMERLEGADITTIEGLAAGGEHPLQIAWAEHKVPQCGYCQSGQIMQAAALLAGSPAPDEQQIDDAMGGVICRCGTYQRIRAAIRSAAGSTAGGGA